MGVKTKIFSLILLTLLALPVILGPQKTGGQVLGASESQDSKSNFPTINFSNPLNTNQSSESSVPKQSSIGQIASGASEIVANDDTKTALKVVKGRVIWEDNAKFKVISDKFPKGSGIQVKYNDKTYPLVIEDSRILSSDTILVVNKDTFIKLGGNPETSSSIEVEAIN